MNAEKSQTKKLGYLGLIVLIFAVISIWALSGLALYSIENRGTFGDMFGAVNALFSGLAFATLIYTIHLQRKELELQREELEATRLEIKGQKEQLATQNEVLKTQNFENTFFQLLKLLNDIVNAIDLNKSGEIIRGRDCFTYFYQTLENRYFKLRRDNTNISDSELIQESYNQLYSLRQGELGHYFRTLYNIIKFVKHSNVEDKHFYTNLVRAQISNQELLIIFYNCLTDYGSEKFKPLIEEFALLKTVNIDKLLDKNLHKHLYLDSAYK